GPGEDRVGRRRRGGRLKDIGIASLVVGPAKKAARERRGCAKIDRGVARAVAQPLGYSGWWSDDRIQAPVRAAVGRNKHADVAGAVAPCAESAVDHDEARIGR